MTMDCRGWVARAGRGWLAFGLFVASIPCSGAWQEGGSPPFVTTPTQVIERMLAMAKVRSDDLVIDLGSGDGRIVIAAAKRFGARALGVEMSAELVQASRRAALGQGVAERARFEQGDIFATDLSAATVLTLYLGPEFNERLLPRILQTMRPGSRIVSHDFALGLWTPDAVERMQVAEKHYGRGGESTVLLWIVPAQASGRWRASIGDAAGAGAIEFSITQQFQFIEAALRTPQGHKRFAAATLKADRIELELAAAAEPGARDAISARIEGDRMVGTYRYAGGRSAPLPFTAQRIASRPDIF
ncbi:MAG: class I SAM-dependent methyltransferase [Burkholderiales bacterium]|nr:class I SAM-dependent methyltransferase [Burkholderiales bacterium]